MLEITTLRRQEHMHKMKWTDVDDEIKSKFELVRDIGAKITEHIP